MVKVSRTPNDGTDNALYASINVDNPAIGIRQRAVSSRSTGDEFSYKTK